MSRLILKIQILSLTSDELEDHSEVIKWKQHIFLSGLMKLCILKEKKFWNQSVHFWS